MSVMNASHCLPQFPHSRHGAISPLHFPHLFLGPKTSQAFSFSSPLVACRTRSPATCPSNSPAAAPSSPLSLPSQHLPPSFRNLWSALCHYTHGRSHPSIKFPSFLSRQAVLDTFRQGDDAIPIGFNKFSQYPPTAVNSVFFIVSLPARGSKYCCWMGLRMH